MTNRHKTSRYRAVIIGCGNIGALLEADPLRPKPATYAGAFSCHKNIKLVGFVDFSNAVLRRARGLFPSVAIYNDAAECIKHEQPDIVAISTPPDSHYQYLRLCKKYKVRAVICEKPICYSVPEALKMNRLAFKSKMLVLVNYQRRFFKLFQRARKKIREGFLGRVRQVTAYYSNGLLNNGSHIIDALRFLLNDEIVCAMGVLNVSNRTHPKNDYNIDGFLFFKHGAVAAIQSFDQNKYGIHEMRLIGDKGMLIITQYGYEFCWISVSAPRLFSGLNEFDYSKQTKEHQKVGMLKGVVDHSIFCLNNHKKPLCTLGDGIKDLRAVLAFVKSAKSGGRRIWLKN